MKIDTNGVKITLTEAQLKEIDAQLNETKLPKLKDLKTFEQACKVEGKDPNHGYFYANGLLSEKEAARRRLEVVIAAANKIVNNGKPWAPDWDNKNQPKYFNYFRKVDGRWAFSRSDYYYSSYDGQVGCYQNREAAEHVGKQFLDLYVQTF